MRDLLLLPKVQLHVHLESTIRWTTLRELGAPASARPPDGSVVFDGFRAFADHNELIRTSVRRPEDFRRIAVEFCADQAAQGTRYAEVTFTAASHGERLGDPHMPLEAVLDGLAEGRTAYGVECQVILDHSRRRSVERAWLTYELAVRHAVVRNTGVPRTGAGVIGIGLAGDEAHPLAPFAEVLDAARDAGLRLVHHAGETAGAASIREAIDVGHTERLGHGIRVLDDPLLVAEVRERAIPLEVCPSSNVTLGLVRSLDAHPLPRLRDAGLVVTVNTDIPSTAGTSNSEEYARVRTAFGYDDETLAELALAAVDASFAPDATKKRLRAETEAWLADGRKPAGPAADGAA